MLFQTTLNCLTVETNYSSSGTHLLYLCRFLSHLTEAGLQYMGVWSYFLGFFFDTAGRDLRLFAYAGIDKGVTASKQSCV